MRRARAFARTAFVLSLPLAVLTSCAHPNRISRNTLQRLVKDREPIVLVFGSLSTPPGTIARPTIRFLQANQSAPEYLLKSLIISNGDRFFAVLQAPQAASEALPHLDEFYIEVGSAETGFDRITYVHMRPTEVQAAMYVGEILMSPAENRAAQGQKVVVNIRDDFKNATQELRRLYPRFEGTIASSVRGRDALPTSLPPERAR